MSEQEKQDTEALEKEIMKKREELIKLSEDGKIKQSVQQLTMSFWKFIMNMKFDKQKKQMNFWLTLS